MIIKCGSKTCGIYKITCVGNNKFYIGSSVDIYYRWASHLSDLRLNRHHSTYLQRSFNKYGEESLVFEVIHEITEYNEELLRMIEQYYIEELHPAFNSATPILYEQTQEWRNKISDTTKRLYTEKGYVNPRKGVGKRYNVYDYTGNLLYSSITMSGLSEVMDISYHTFNSMLRKYNGICCSSKHKCLIMELSKTVSDVIVLYKTSNFFLKCPLCDLEGNTYERGNCSYYSKGSPGVKGKGITFRAIYKDILNSDMLYTTVDNKVFTLPFLCRFIQQCISNNT